MSENDPLVDDLADVLASMVVGWERTLGVDLAEHPSVQRVMGRYRAAKAEHERLIIVLDMKTQEINRLWPLPVDTIHPWGEPPLQDGWCDLCFASDGDGRCLRCGRSTGGPDACVCPHGPLIGPCAGG